MSTLFISDLHLNADRPAITELFLDFLHKQAREAEALYILGDLFEAWLGDDLVLPEYRHPIEAMHELSKTGVPIFVMHGNRDFLLRDGFARISGSTLIPDPTVITLYGTPTVLMHGDTLCTDDTAYQQFRQMVRDPDWQNALLAKTPQERVAIAREYRAMSKTETSGKTEAIMDVNPATVEQAFREFGLTQMIHGHTHRPRIHHFSVEGKPAQRIVLGDWYSQGSVLVCDESGCELRTLS